MRYLTKKAGQRFEKAFGSDRFTESTENEEGSISIDKMPSSGSKSKNTVGEYVDYEEVE